MSMIDERQLKAFDDLSKMQLSVYEIYKIWNTDVAHTSVMFKELNSLISTDNKVTGEYFGVNSNFITYDDD